MHIMYGLCNHLDARLLFPLVNDVQNLHYRRVACLDVKHGSLKVARRDRRRGQGSDYRRTLWRAWRTIGDQRDRDRISAENVIAIAIGYGRHPVTALIDCGYLPARYATEADPIIALRKVSEDELAAEVLRRMKLAGDHVTLATPIDELPQLRAARERKQKPNYNDEVQDGK